VPTVKVFVEVIGGGKMLADIDPGVTVEETAGVIAELAGKSLVDEDGKAKNWRLFAPKPDGGFGPADRSLRLIGVAGRMKRAYDAGDDVGFAGPGEHEGGKYLFKLRLFVPGAPPKAPPKPDHPEPIADEDAIDLTNLDDFDTDTMRRKKKRRRKDGESSTVRRRKKKDADGSTIRRRKKKDADGSTIRRRKKKKAAASADAAPEASGEVATPEGASEEAASAETAAPEPAPVEAKDEAPAAPAEPAPASAESAAPQVSEPEPEPEPTPEPEPEPTPTPTPEPEPDPEPEPTPEPTPEAEPDPPAAKEEEEPSAPQVERVMEAPALDVAAPKPGDAAVTGPHTSPASSTAPAPAEAAAKSDPPEAETSKAETSSRRVKRPDASGTSRRMKKVGSSKSTSRPEKRSGGKGPMIAIAVLVVAGAAAFALTRGGGEAPDTPDPTPAPVAESPAESSGGSLSDRVALAAYTTGEGAEGDAVAVAVAGWAGLGVQAPGDLAGKLGDAGPLASSVADACKAGARFDACDAWAWMAFSSYRACESGGRNCDSAAALADAREAVGRAYANAQSLQGAAKSEATKRLLAQAVRIGGADFAALEAASGPVAALAQKACAKLKGAPECAAIQ